MNGSVVSRLAGRLLIGGALFVSLVRPVSAAAPDTTRSILPYLGRSGKLRVIPSEAAKVLRLPALERLFGRRGDLDPGFHDLEMAAPDGEPVRLMTLVPFSAKRGGMVGSYRVGFWPGERGGASKVPTGFIPVSHDDAALPISKRFHLADFLTHDQSSVWPKYLVLDPKLVDKLELLGDALDRLGRSSKLVVMSGFRTPQYNAKGVGAGGRAKDSQHMYGNAADVFVDGDGDGRMDDLDGDGRVTQADAAWLLRVAEGVERDHPAVLGGLSAYKATAAHGPFLHVDVRGTRARW